jgi:hypothetical protein
MIGIKASLWYLPPMRLDDGRNDRIAVQEKARWKVHLRLVYNVSNDPGIIPAKILEVTFQHFQP